MSISPNAHKFYSYWLIRKLYLFLANLKDALRLLYLKNMIGKCKCSLLLQGHSPSCSHFSWLFYCRLDIQNWMASLFFLNLYWTLRFFYILSFNSINLFSIYSLRLILNLDFYISQSKFINLTKEKSLSRSPADIITLRAS